MNFRETELAGAFLIEPEILTDERGFFARTFCREEFSAHGLEDHIAQCNVSYNELAGTLRGLHFQAPPYGEAKLVRCTMGAVHDVILDLRRESPTFGVWTAVELTAENRRMLYVPRGFAHGFQTLCDHAEVFYQMSAPYHAGSARGIRWDDSFLNIAWPLPPTRISEQDRGFPGLATYTATGEPGAPILQ